MKVRNLKANHNNGNDKDSRTKAVLASVKVRNLKANHNSLGEVKLRLFGCISKCEGTESES